MYTYGGVYCVHLPTLPTRVTVCSDIIPIRERFCIRKEVNTFTSPLSPPPPLSLAPVYSVLMFNH